MAQPGPLCGITIVDLSRILAGPYCTLLLAERHAGDQGRAAAGRRRAPLRPVQERQIGLFRVWEGILAYRLDNRFRRCNFVQPMPSRQ